MTEETLHFLRPLWLWTLIPIAFIGWLLWRQHLQQGGWQRLIAEPFKPVLLSKQDQQKNALPLIGLLLIWLITVIALSGPTWQKVEIPAEKNRQASVILLDLSLSMLSDDLKPNRLSRARFQLMDLLKSHPEQQFGMVVYAGSAHTITPISEDPQTLINLTPSLSPLIMPSMGAKAMTGLQQAQRLLNGAHINQGHLIWLTDSVEADEVDSIKAFLDTHNLTLSLITIGTEAGAPIPVPNFGLLKQDNGQLILAKLPVTEFQRLAEHPNIEWHPLTQQPIDTDRLLPAPFLQNPANAHQNRDKPKTLTSWLDQGIYLLWLLLPIIALSFRRGWIFSQVSIGLIPVLLWVSFYPVNSYSNDKAAESVSLLDVLKSNDQQGYENWQRQNYEAALNQFESPLWKGVSYYRMQQYAEAAEQFKRSDSAESQYNLGNALAQLGQLQPAKEAYQKALKAKPNWQAAQQNLQLIEQLLQQQQNQQPSDSNTNNTRDAQSNQIENSPNNKNEASNPNTDSQDSKNQNQQSEQNGQSTDKETQPKADSENQADSGAEDQKATEINPATEEKADLKSTSSASLAKDSPQSKPQTEAERAQQNWLNQIPHEPGLFLKRKFEYQFQQKRDPSTDNTKIW